MVPDATAREVGEFGLIERVVERLGTSAAVLLGPGDDAAVLLAPDGRVVATTDVLVEGVHFRSDWSSAYDVGRKAAAANLSDVAAMGATGTALLVGLAAPGGLPVSWATGLADGLRDESALVGAVVVGGDTVTGDRIVVSVTALGDLAGRAPVTRAGAAVGDDVVLAGALGWSALGLLLLSRGTASAQDPGAVPPVPDEAAQAVGRHRAPQPPYAAGPLLADAGATSMCDVSDGLVADAGRLAAAGRVRIALEHVDDASLEGLRGLLGDDAVERALLHGGEDHALLATVPRGTPLPRGVRRIGRVVPGDGVTIGGSPVEPQGWEHFS
ncbi:MAG: thiamine-phosphate kinase [Mycobacteriales bacterium]